MRTEARCALLAALGERFGRGHRPAGTERVSAHEAFAGAREVPGVCDTVSRLPIRDRRLDGGLMESVRPGICRIRRDVFPRLGKGHPALPAARLQSSDRANATSTCKWRR